MKKIKDEELLVELQQRFVNIKGSLDEHALLLKKLRVVNSKLKESEQLKTQFLSNIRNEINNPLSAMLAISDTIINSSKFDMEAVKTGVQLIHDEAFYLDFQLRNIFLAAEIEAGETIPHISKVNVQGLIHNILDYFSGILEKEKVNVVVKEEGCGDSTDFQTDSEKLHAILSNLLYNAIEYGGRGSEIVIQTDCKNGELEISVKDNGIGIEKGELNSIFDRFKQLDSGTTKNYAGHGLGLSIVKALVDILEGNILVESEIGVGSNFIVRLQADTSNNRSNNFSSDGNELLFEEQGYSEEERF